MERVYDYETFLDMNTICEYLVPISNNFLDIFNEICTATYIYADMIRFRSDASGSKIPI